MSVCTSDTSDTSVSDLLCDGSPAKPRHGQLSVPIDPRGQPSAPIDVARWAKESTALVDSPTASRLSPEGDTEACSPGVLQLQRDVANKALSDYKARTRQLEAQVRELRAQLEDGSSSREMAKSSQALLLERIQELEAQLCKSAESEQAKAAQLARLESRAAVAEGSLKAAEQQVSQALTELQEQRAKELGELEARHARDLARLQEQHSAALAQVKAGYEGKVEELTKAARAAEQAAQRDAQRAKEAAAALEKEWSRQAAVKELMRHSEELQAQLDRAQAALAEERRRAAKLAQAAESSLAAEKHLAGVTAQELQIKMQDLSREHEKAARQLKAKLQRAEADLRGAKQHSMQLAARVTELETTSAQKEQQLDMAASEVSAMQRELQTLRQGLSSQEASAVEATRVQYRAALDECRADLAEARRQLSEQALLAQRQGAALGTVADILAAHAAGADKEGLPAVLRQQQQQQAAQAGGSVRPAVDPEKVVAFVEAVSGTLADLQQQWELERAEMAQALGGAEAVQAQLESLLQQEREEGRRLAGEVAQLQAAQERLLAAERRAGELEVTQRTLDACRADLTNAAAKAVAATEECAKWRSTVEAVELQLQQAVHRAELSERDLAELRSAVAAKDERIREMRSAMAAAMDDRSTSASDLQRKLASLQHAEQQLEDCRAELAQYKPTAAAAAQVAAEAVPKLDALLQLLERQEGPAERLSLVLSAAIKPAAAALRSLAAPGASPANGPATLSSVVLQLCDGLGHAAEVLQERTKVHNILSNVNAKLRDATAQHTKLLTAGGSASRPEEQGTASLVTLLQQLTENVVGLIESLAVEKESISSEMVHVAEENQLLQSQIHSMQSVLASLQSDGGNLEMQLADAIMSCNQAQARAAGLEADNAVLAQQLQQAQQAVDSMRAATNQQWSGMRDDIARLVQHAEQAQLDAEAAVERLKVECAEKVTGLQQQLEQAAAGRATAEAAAADLRNQLHSMQEQHAQLDGQTKANVHAALLEAHQSVEQLEQQVALLQRKLLLKAKVGVSRPALKKAAAASSKVALLKRENDRLKGTQQELGEKVAKLEATIRQGAQQLKQCREQAATSQAALSDAQAKAARLEALLRKVDERKTVIDVERKRAQEAVARLEQQVLELQCKLEAAQHRERMAASDAEQSRAALARREQEAKQLAGAVEQVEVAEGALRDAHATASRLLHECTDLRQANQELQAEADSTAQQLQEAQQAHADVLQQVADLQEAFDTALTELDIARSLLANQQQQQQQQQRPESGQGLRQPEFPQHIVAFPMTLGALQTNQQDSQQRQQAADQLVKYLAGGSRPTLGRCTPPGQPGCQPSEQPEAHTSPLTQQQLRTPCTPLTAYKGNGASAPHMADDASSRRPTPEPDGASFDENCQPAEGRHRPGSAGQPAGRAASRHASPARRPLQRPLNPRPGSRPDSAASTTSAAPHVDVDDVRGLVLAVEKLQRQLAVKQDRIQELRAALQQQQQQQQQQGATARSSSGSAEAFVLQQKLQAATQQLQVVTRQLADAEQAKCEFQARLAVAPATLLDIKLKECQQQLRQLERQVEERQEELVEAQAHADALEVELAERDAAMEAMEARLASATAGGSCITAGRSCGGTQTEGGSVPGMGLVVAVRPASRPSSLTSERAGTPDSARATSALSSLDRIVGLWKQACQAKDKKLRELQGRLGEAHDALAAAEAAHDALQQQVQDSAMASHGLQQMLASAQLDLAAARAKEQDMSSRLAELEAELGACRGDLQEARQQRTDAERGKAEAERHCGSLEQQLEITQAQVREVQHAAQLERLSRGDADALRQQLAATRVELDAAREMAVAARQRADTLNQQLQEQRAAAAAAAASSSASSQLSRQQVEAAEQRLAREVQGCQAQLRVAQQEAVALQWEVAVREAQLRQVTERLERSEAQLGEALEAVQQQSAALVDMQHALEQARQEQQHAVEASAEHQHAATALAGAQQQLALMHQRLEVADKQMEVLRAQLNVVEGDRAKMAAEQQRLQAQEARLNDATQRYQSGMAVLTRALRQLQSADVQGGLDVLAVLGHYQGSLASSNAQQQQHGSGGGEGGARDEVQLPVEELVDELLFYLHRRDCDVTALLAQVSQLEAALAAKAAEALEQQARLQGQAGSVARVKEQLSWCVRECEALKRQLADKDQQIARLRAVAAGSVAAAEGGGHGVAGLGAVQRGVGSVGGWPSAQQPPQQQRRGL